MTAISAAYRDITAAEIQIISNKDSCEQTTAVNQAFLYYQIAETNLMRGTKTRQDESM